MEPKALAMRLPIRPSTCLQGPLALLGHCFSPNPRASSRKDRVPLADR
jgi:hypothetical protein